MNKSSTKRRARDRAARPLMAAWREAQIARCSVCWSDRGKIDLHHLVAGSGRKDVPANWLLLCRACHREYHDHLLLTPGMLLWCKRECDLENFSMVTIAILRGMKRMGDDPRWIVQRPAEVFIRERERNR